MSSIPRRALIRTALVTSPLIGAAMVTPLYIISELSAPYYFLMLAAVTTLALISWLLHILLLPYMVRLGRVAWVQVLVAGLIMVMVSFIVYTLVDPDLPPIAKRLPLVRYVNIFVVSAIIYVLIRLQLLSDVKARLAEEVAQLRFHNLEAQHRLLREQVNPHFLFNALGTAKSLVRRDPVLAENYIIRLSDFLRASLQEAPNQVPLKDELRLVRDYVGLQQMRFKDAMVYECTVAAEQGGLRVPYGGVLTLVENAVKHNALTAEAPLHIRVYLDGARICVENPVRPKASRAPGNGSGLKNLAERSRLLGHGEIEVIADADRFLVRLPLLPPV